MFLNFLFEQFVMILIDYSFYCSLLQQLTQELEQDETRSFRVGSPVASSPPGNQSVDALKYLLALPSMLGFLCRRTVVNAISLTCSAWFGILSQGVGHKLVALWITVPYNL